MLLLNGVRIVAFTQFLLGPVAVQYLTDLGAEAVKIEPPRVGSFERRWAGGGGIKDGYSFFYAMGNRNVRSLGVDIKTRQGKDIALGLIAGADVVVANYRPGVMARLELDYDSLKDSHPGLVYASASGYGSAGELPGQDLLLQAQTGMAQVTGGSDQPPTAAGAPVVDQHSASLLAMGILAALYDRARTGRGRHVEIDMVGGGLDLQSEPLTYHLNGAHLDRPGPYVGSTFHQAPYGIYPTADGHLAISMGAVPALGLALGHEQALDDYADLDRSFADRDHIASVLAPLIRRWSTDSLVSYLRSKDLWCAPVHDYASMLEDPDIDAGSRIVDFDQPGVGRVSTLAHPVTYDGVRPSVRRRPPTLGEDTDHLLAELGYTREKIAEFKDLGVV